MQKWATDFSDILPTLAVRPDLRAAMHACSSSLPAPGKALEGPGRLASFRTIIADVIDAQVSLEASYRVVEEALQEEDSPYAGNRRVFASGWPQRLVRTRLSVLYNHVALDAVVKNGDVECRIEHSSAEDAASPCSRLLAGKQHNARHLFDRLVDTHIKGNFSSTDPKLPDHPHCTHVARPIAGSTLL